MHTLAVWAWDEVREGWSKMTENNQIHQFQRIKTNQSLQTSSDACKMYTPMKFYIMYKNNMKKHTMIFLPVFLILYL